MSYQLLLLAFKFPDLSVIPNCLLSTIDCPRYYRDRKTRCETTLTNPRLAWPGMTFWFWHSKYSSVRYKARNIARGETVHVRGLGRISILSYRYYSKKYRNFFFAIWVSIPGRPKISFFRYPIGFFFFALQVFENSK